MFHSLSIKIHVSLLFTLSLFLFHVDCIAQKDSTKNAGTFQLTTFNDSWGGGTTHIYDDLRSYGFTAKLDLTNRFSFKIIYSGLTNKSLRAPQNSGRIDELLVNTDVLIQKRIFNCIDLYGRVGLYFVGNYGGDYLQETVHHYFNIQTDILSYKDGSGMSGQFGIKAVTRPLILKAFESASFIIQPEMETYIIPNYFFVLKPEIPVKISSPEGQYISLSIGYRYTYLYSSENVITNVVNSESGPVIDFKMMLGFFSINFITYTKSNFSIGTYGFNFLINRTTNKYQQTDVAAEFGFLSAGNGYYTKLLWNKTKLFPEHFMFLLYDQYSTYLQKRLKDYPESYGNYQQVGLGGEVNFFKTKQKFQLNPYVGFNAGIKRDMVYAGTIDRETSQLISPQITGEAGLKIQLPNSLIYKNTLWGIVLNYKYSQLLTNEHKAFEQANQLKVSNSYLGIGVFVLMDL